MSGFLLRRLAAALLLVLLVVTVVFFLLHLAPGDPARLVEGPRTSPEQRALLRARWGLDRPLPEQYALWLAAAARGDWGSSFVYQRPVTRVIAEAVPSTLLLALAALAVEYSAALVLGMAAARRRGGWADHLIRIVSLLLNSVPVFWLGLVAVLLFSYVWPILPASHMRSVDAADLPPLARALDLLRHLALPALVLGLATAGGTARLVRNSLLETLGQDYVRTARAKGLPERRVVWVHALRNALVPLTQTFALSLSALLNGALVTEVVFSWPGLGRLTFDAILTRDYPLILAVTAFSATLTVLGNLLADVLHAAADPRVRDAG